MDQPNPHVKHVGSLYGYVPTEWVCIVFIAFFSASTTAHLIQAIYFKLWWLIPTAVVAGIVEVIGWAGRLWSSRSPAVLKAYLMQISTTILAPTFFVAANFIILGHIIRRFGMQYSRLKPNHYAIVFCSADLVALIVQAVGGGSASIAVQTNKNPERGGHIMLAGIAIQLAAIIIYVTLAAEFLLRVTFNRPIARPSSPASPAESIIEEKETEAPETPLVLSRRDKLMLSSLSFSTLCLFIRAVYRLIELKDGWTGRIIHTQRYFNFLDGMMIVLAMICLNVLHPGWLLPKITKSS